MPLNDPARRATWRRRTATLVLAMAVAACSAGSAGDASSEDSGAPLADAEARADTVERNLLSPQRIRGVTEPAAIADRMAALGVPGASVAVFVDGELDWARGYGSLVAGEGPEVDPETLFQAASISKPVAVSAMLRLVDAGRLELDRDVNDYLQSWTVPSNEHVEAAPVTLRGIASHTAGLTVHGFPGYSEGTPLPTVPQILDGAAPANTAAVRVDKAPGGTSRYSGGGTTVLQLLLSDVTGQPFPELMRELVLDPVGMRRSTYEQPLPDGLRDNAATAHRRGAAPIDGRWHTYPEMAAAGLWTTPSDLARFAMAIQRAAAGDEGALLSRELAREALTPVDASAGLGLFVSGPPDARRFGHGGSNEGFRCEMFGFVDGRGGAVVMTNADSGGVLAQEVINAVAVVYGWPGIVPDEIVPVALDDEAMDALVGTYDLRPSEMLPAGEVTIRREGDRLVVQALDLDPAEMLPLSPRRFRLIGPGGEIEVVEVDGRRQLHIPVAGTTLIADERE